LVIGWWLVGRGGFKTRPYFGWRLVVEEQTTNNNKEQTKN
jgi:hypothetical protein